MLLRPGAHRWLEIYRARLLPAVRRRWAGVAQVVREWWGARRRIASVRDADPERGVGDGSGAVAGGTVAADAEAAVAGADPSVGGEDRPSVEITAPALAPHIVGEIDLGRFGKIVKREDDQWFTPPLAPKPDTLPPPAVKRPRGPRRKKAALLATSAAVPLADVAAQIQPPTNKDELKDVLGLLQQTPEFTSGKYVLVPPKGGLRWSDYDPGFFPHNDDAGIFYFRGDLLNELDQYFYCLRRMRLADVGAYDLYSQVGATILPSVHLVSSWDLPSLWHDRAARPGFGCVSYCGVRQKNSEKFLWPRLLYFQKMSTPSPRVEPMADADVYEITCYFDDTPETQPKKMPAWARRHGIGLSYFVAVTKNNDLRLLKTLQTSHIKVTKRMGEFQLSNKGNPGTRVRKVNDYIPYKSWDHPEYLSDWWNDSKKLHMMNLEQWACSMFCGIASTSISVEYAVRINVSNARGDTAVFCVSPERFAYFFRDRDVVTDERGRRARIFHFVKPFQRDDGGYVRGHFRGVRRFKWGPYRVNITVPGLHHRPIAEWTPGMSDVEALPPEERKELLHSKNVGHVLARHIAGMGLRQAIEAEAPGYDERRHERRRAKQEAHGNG